MIELTNVEIIQPNPSYILIRWQVKPTADALSDYSFRIYKSGAPSKNVAEYEILVPDIGLDTTQEYLDHTVEGMTNKFTNHYYMLQIVRDADQVTREFGPYHIQTRPDKFAREIIRRRDLVLKHHSGQPFKSFIRKTHGQFCEECFDPVLMRIKKANCEECFGVGFVDGYYPPITFNAQLNEAPKRNQIAVFGSWQDQDGILVMGEYPIMTPRDFIVDVLGRRWKIVTMRPTNKSMFVINQNLQIRQIERGNIIYKVGIDG